MCVGISAMSIMDVGGGSSITIMVIKNPSEGSFQNQHPHNIKVKPLHQFWLRLSMTANFLSLLRLQTISNFYSYFRLKNIFTLYETKLLFSSEHFQSQKWLYNNHSILSKASFKKFVKVPSFLWLLTIRWCLIFVK